MNDNEGQDPLRVLLLDGSELGTTEFCQLEVLEETAHRISSKGSKQNTHKEALLCDYFDVIGGTGVGGLVAILAVLFKMHVGDIAKIYFQLHKQVFSESDWKEASLDQVSNATKIEQVLRDNLPGDLDKPIIQRVSKKNCIAILCSINPENTSQVRRFSTSPSKIRPAPCSIIEALQLSLADGLHLPPVSLGHPPETFTGSAHRFNNPIFSCLQEIEAIFDTSQPIACLVSIGTGTAYPLSSHKLQEIVQDCEREAGEWGRRCSEVAGLFYRFNPQCFAEDLTSIKVATKQYLQEPATECSLDKLVDQLITPQYLVDVQQLVSLGEGGASGGHLLKILSKQQEEHVMKIRKWLCPFNPLPSRLRVIREERTPTTGNWLLDSIPFRSWLKGSTPLFVLEGIPGGGKTYLAQTVFDYISRPTDSNSIVLGHFIQYNGTMDWLEILANLLSQVLFTPADVPQELETFYQSRELLNEEQLSRILAHKLKRFDPIYLVLDALDEFSCDYDHRKNLVSNLLSLSPNLRLFVTCRPIPHEVYSAHPAQYFYLRESERQDMEAFIHQRLDQESPLRTVLHSHPELKQRILSETMERSCNLFLLARLHLGQIARCRTPLAVGRGLQSLPYYPVALYEEALDRIRNQDPKDVLLALHAFIWIIHGFSAFTMDLLLTAVAASTEDIVDRRVESARILPETLLGLCGGLLVISDDGYVKLVHITLLDFFKSEPHGLLEDPHHILGTGCLRYLTSSHTSEELGYFQDFPHGSSFFHYCISSWMGHFHKAKQDISDSILSSFFQNEGIYSICVEQSDNLDSQCTPLHTAAYFGIHTEILGILTNLKLSVNCLDSQNQTALHYAALHPRHTKSAEILLSRGATSSKNKMAQTPLWHAIHANNMELISMLLAHDGDPWHLQSGNDISPVSYAASHNQWEIVKLLLSSVPNSGDIDDDTPLGAAAREGYSEVVKLLLRDDVTGPKPQDEDRNTPLHNAAENGHSEVVKVLLTREELDPNLQNNNKIAPLHSAVFQGHINVVKVLLADPRVNPNQLSGRGQSPLHLAALQGESELVQVLLSNEELDPNIQNCDKATALGVAVNKEASEVVTLLLADPRVDPNIPGKENDTPLHSAALHGKIQAVGLLLGNKRVNATSENHNKDIPLHHAAANGELGVMKIFIEDGRSNINACNEDHKTPLHYAAARGQSNVVRLLLDHGDVLVNCRDGHDKTPLHLAAESGHSEVVKLLLSKQRVKVDLGDDHGKIPLHYAAKEGNLDVVKLLLQDHMHMHRVDPNRRTDNGKTPIDYALLSTSDDRRAIIALLQEHGVERATSTKKTVAKVRRIFKKVQKAYQDA